MSTAKGVLTLISFAAIVESCSVPASAGTPDSLCVHMTGTIDGEHVTLAHRYELGGILPAKICNLEPGVRYRLTLGGDGLERRIGAFTIDGEGRAAVHGVQFSAVGRNIVLPGWGSVYARRAGAGLSDDISLGASLVVLYQEEMVYIHLRNRLAVQEDRLAEAASYEDRERFQFAAREASLELNVQNDYRRRLAILAGALYAWQVVEPFLTDDPPGSAAGAASGEITVRGSRESHAKAFLYSLVRPGRGQFYQGKTARGIFFSVATLAGGLAALHYQNEYDFALDDYQVCVERFNATDVVSEKKQLLDKASGLWSSVERERDRRNASLIALAGVWGWNVIDTFFGRGAGEAGPHRYSLHLDGREAWLAVHF
jgi:hypothetical protein